MTTYTLMVLKIAKKAVSVRFSHIVARNLD